MQPFYLFPTKKVDFWDLVYPEFWGTESLRHQHWRGWGLALQGVNQTTLCSQSIDDEREMVRMAVIYDEREDNGVVDIVHLEKRKNVIQRMETRLRAPTSS